METSVSSDQSYLFDLTLWRHKLVDRQADAAFSYLIASAVYEIWVSSDNQLLDISKSDHPWKHYYGP